MDLKEYRTSPTEQLRTAKLLELVDPIADKDKCILDCGAREGHFSKLFTNYFDSVTALDLVRPSITDDTIQCVQGDITNLEFSDNSFDFVFCAEVLEHIQPNELQKACSELSRVSKKYVIVGVPYKQDIRVGRTTCYSCGGKNPPWGHVNSFDEKRLAGLFPQLNVKEISYVGKNSDNTNFISTWLMDLAGNPFGTYEQDEACTYCGNTLLKPPKRNPLQRVFTRTSFYLSKIQKPLYKPRAAWIHVLFEK